jgi:hypothetical protein
MSTGSPPQRANVPWESAHVADEHRSASAVSDARQRGQRKNAAISANVLSGIELVPAIGSATR